jgi:hypothetical protein
MENMHEFPSSREPSDLENRIFFAHNFIQIYYAKLEYRNTHEGDDAVPEAELVRIMGVHSDDFRNWYSSPEGMLQIEKYVAEHDEKAIEAMDDMGDLAQSFLGFMNRPKQENQV